MLKSKKLLSFCLSALLCVLALTACGGEKGGSDIAPADMEALSGNWKLVLYDLYDVKMLPEDQGTEMTLVFSDDGTLTWNVDGTEETYKWEKDDTLLTIWVPDGAVSRGRSAVLEGDSLTVYWKYDDAPVKMIFAKEGSAAADPALYISEDDVTSTMMKNATEDNILELLEKMTPEAREAFDLATIYDELKGEEE